ncbi:MAG: hypothetical protein LKF43_11065 [Streptococcaceae bacterium]|jgi:hypothetical protein|nr:hypothetical protein [Streptococcaceae bacterium]
MKKNYFIKTFNLIFNLICFSSLAFIVEWLSILIDTHLIEPKKSEMMGLFVPLNTLLNQASSYAHQIGIALSIMTAFLVAIEILTRLQSDHLINYFKSIKQTFKLRYFMRQREQTEKIIETQTVTAVNPIHRQFN